LLQRGENSESACFQDQKANGGGAEEIAEKIYTLQQKQNEREREVELQREGTAKGNLSLQVHFKKF